MRKTTSSIVCALLAGMTCGCNQAIDHVDQVLTKRIDQLSTDMEKTRATITAVVDTTTKAIPGGTYNLELSNLFGDDPKKREEAQRFFKNLLGENAVSPNWRLDIRANWPDTAQVVHGSFITIAAPAKSLVQEALVARPAFPSLRRGLVRNKTPEEIDGELTQTIGKFLDQTFGDGKILDVGALGGGGGTLIWQQLRSPIRPLRMEVEEPDWAPNELKQWRKDNEISMSVERPKAINLLKQAILLATREQTAFEGEVAASLRDWHPLKPDQVLVALIPEADLNAIDYKITINVSSVHDDKPVGETVQLETDYFRRHPALIDPADPEQKRLIRWAPMRLTNAHLVSPEMVKDVQQMQKALDDLNSSDHK